MKQPPPTIEALLVDVPSLLVLRDGGRCTLNPCRLAFYRKSGVVSQKKTLTQLGTVLTMKALRTYTELERLQIENCCYVFRDELISLRETGQGCQFNAGVRAWLMTHGYVFAGDFSGKYELNPVLSETLDAIDEAEYQRMLEVCFVREGEE